MDYIAKIPNVYNRCKFIKQWSDAHINKTAIGDQSVTKEQTQKLED
jgi:hypothetical protein